MFYRYLKFLQFEIKVSSKRKQYLRRNRAIITIKNLSRHNFYIFHHNQFIIQLSEILEMDKQTILLTSVGLTGHLGSVVVIADYLSQQGYPILFVTSKKTEKSVKQMLSKGDVLGIQDRCAELSDEKFGKKAPFQQMSSYWKDQIIQSFIGKRKVSLIITDFASLSILKLAKKLKIKLAINFPGPVELFQILNYPTFKKSITFAGFTILLPQIIPFIVSKKLRFLAQASESLQESIVFFNSFFGFDEPVVLPSNIKMTGPLINSWNPSPIQNQLKQWLDYVRSQNLDIIYVTFGSLIHLTKHFFQKLYYDLKQTKKAILWTIPQEDNVLPQKNTKFFTSKWLPQISILRLPEVKVVLTHCGWNGTIECIYHQKPMLCCPGFADQSMNSQKVQKAGIGLILRPQKPFINKKPLDNPKWTTQQFVSKVQDLATNEKYTNQLKKLKGFSEETGGLNTVLTTVQNYLKNGNDHLIDKSVNRIRQTGLNDTLKWIVIIFIAYLFFNLIKII